MTAVMAARVLWGDWCGPRWKLELLPAPLLWLALDADKDGCEVVDPDAIRFTFTPLCLQRLNVGPVLENPIIGCIDLISSKSQKLQLELAMSQHAVLPRLFRVHGNFS